MLHFNTSSWHYRLVMYIFGKNFFTEHDTIDMTEYKKSAKIVWTRKPKVINFCPYCRGVLWSALSLPFVYIWRIFFPHDSTKVMTHEQTMKRMKIRGMLIRSIGGSIQFPFALMNYLSGEYLIAAINIIAGFLIIATFVFIPGNNRLKKILGSPLEKYLWPLIKPIINFISKSFEKKEEKKIHKPKNPSILAAYLHTKHSAICPPVCFIEKVDQENLR